MSQILTAGTTIVCMRKLHLIAILLDNHDMRFPLSTKNISFTDGQGNIAGEEPCCKICGSRYIIDGNVCTLNGWYPADPKLEPVAP